MFYRGHDQLGTLIQLTCKPQRIISLVPSQTELLFDLGLADSIAGITKFCVHPANQVIHKTKIGGTKKFNFKLINQLQPDLIIGNKEENYKDGIEQLRQHYPVWMSDIYNLSDACDMIEKIGELTDTTTQSQIINNNIKTAFANFKSLPAKRVAYFIWKKPYMVVGNNTFINSMLKQIGLINIFSCLDRYQEVTLEQIQQAQVDWLLLSSEPFPFTAKHIAEFQQLFPDQQIKLVDGQMFSWYGSRLQYAPQYFATLNL